MTEIDREQSCLHASSRSNLELSDLTHSLHKPEIQDYCWSRRIFDEKRAKYSKTYLSYLNGIQSGKLAFRADYSTSIIALKCSMLQLFGEVFSGSALTMHSPLRHAIFNCVGLLNALVM